MDKREQFVEAQRALLDRYGVEAQSRFIEIAFIGGRAHVLVSGEGPAVVMINGIGTPGAMFAPLMSELKNFQLFVVDLPGYGLTDTTDGFAKNLQSNAVRFLTGVLDKLGLETAPFVANSMGSLWTIWLSLDRPGKVSSMIHLGCPAVVLDTSAPLPMRLLSVKILGRLLTRLQPPSEKQVEQLSKMVHEYPMEPELIRLLVATEKLPGFRSMFLSTLNKLLRLSGNRPGMRVTREQLTRLQQPALIFWGEDDPFGSPETGKQMVEQMSDAELHVVGGGHAPWLTQSKRIGPIATRFLNKVI